MDNRSMLEDIDKAVAELKEKYKFCGIKLVENNALKGTQVIIKRGENYYYSPDIKRGEVKIIELPPHEEVFSPYIYKTNFFEEESLSVIANQNVFNAEKYFDNDK